MQTIRLNVTQRDVAKGRQGEAQDCPVAISLKRRGYDPAVTSAYWRHAGGDKTFTLSNRLGIWIRQYDRTEVTKKVSSPIRVTVEVPYITRKKGSVGFVALR